MGKWMRMNSSLSAGMIADLTTFVGTDMPTQRQYQTRRTQRRASQSACHEPSTTIQTSVLHQKAWRHAEASSQNAFRTLPIDRSHTVGSVGILTQSLETS